MHVRAAASMRARFSLPSLRFSLLTARVRLLIVPFVRISQMLSNYHTYSKYHSRPYIYIYIYIYICI